LLQPLVSIWMWGWKCSQPWSVCWCNQPGLRTLPPPHSDGNQRLQRQFDRLLMMGILMPETCWAVSVRQSNKFYDWLLHLAGCFYLSEYRRDLVNNTGEGANSCMGITNFNLRMSRVRKMV
jgi:hypothetical protein